VSGMIAGFRVVMDPVVVVWVTVGATVIVPEVTGPVVVLVVVLVTAGVVVELGAVIVVLVGVSGKSSVGLADAGTEVGTELGAVVSTDVVSWAGIVVVVIPIAAIWQLDARRTAASPERAR
jgi:hypothetical protein